MVSALETVMLYAGLGPSGFLIPYSTDWYVLEIQSSEI